MAIGLMQEIAYKVRSSTWRDVWAWFMVGHGLRLWVTVGWAAYLVYAYGSCS